MTQLKETRKVAVPVEEAFRYVADFDNIEQWDPGVAESSRVGSGELGVGSEFDVMVSFGPSKSRMRYIITTYEPHSRVVLEGKGERLTAIDDIRFAAVPGGTEVDYTADLEFNGFMRYLEPLLGGVLNKVGEKALDGLSEKLGPLE